MRSDFVRTSKNILKCIMIVMYNLHAFYSNCIKSLVKFTRGFLFITHTGYEKGKCGGAVYSSHSRSVEE
ncbi:hypothetical protein SAMN02910344_00710 [Ruminobacter amylophilus]|jgi:hypothetical protein|uniref:Uncharacterized protein n=1 Tax=Ruminobacter amylophilus TaxID=867 RepID=A0A662ZJ34_9GAMM|nr:hypothetical protein SAMN02910344_00710 [Ruminobacter amylophilus]